MFYFETFNTATDIDTVKPLSSDHPYQWTNHIMWENISICSQYCYSYHNGRLRKATSDFWF